MCQFECKPNKDLFPWQEKLFITGTDTRGENRGRSGHGPSPPGPGHRVGVMKPVTSGCVEVDGRHPSVNSRTPCLRGGARPCREAEYFLPGGTPGPQPLLRPRKGAGLISAGIREAFDRLAARHEFMIVEGAGGLIGAAGRRPGSDLIGRLELPLLVIARPDLGTVNHSVLTCSRRNRSASTLRGVIINNYPENPDLAAEWRPT